MLCFVAQQMFCYTLRQLVAHITPSACDRFSYFLETGEFVVRGGGADTVGATNYLNFQRSIWLHGKFHENVACIVWPVWHTDWFNVCASS